MALIVSVACAALLMRAPPLHSSTRAARSTTLQQPDPFAAFKEFAEKATDSFDKAREEVASKQQPATGASQPPPAKASAESSRYSDDELTRLALTDPKSLTDDEMRRVKLELSANYRPRTSTRAGEGYTFFQSPSPKTGVQENEVDFFSADNFKDVGLGAKLLAASVVVGLLVLFLAVLFSTPQSYGAGRWF